MHKLYYIIGCWGVFLTYGGCTIPEGFTQHYDSYISLKMASPKNIFKDFSSLETPRLLLRKVQLTDLEDISAITADPEVTKFTSTLELTKSKKEVELLISIMLERYADDLPTRWVIVHKEKKKVIGICGFFDYIPMYARAELGYALAREYWGQGLGSEAAQAVVDFGFKHMNLNRIEATVDPANKPSAHILEKVGMKSEGILRQHIFKNGKYCDRKMYAIVKDEWQEERSYE